jgi:site-specific DNA recombinase
MARRKPQPASLPRPPVVRALGYARVSTDKQAENRLSLDQQVSDIESRCKAEGWELIDIFIDAGISGKTTKRPQFKAMIDRAFDPASQIDLLIFPSLSRLGRSFLNQEQLMQKLHAASIRMVSLAENVSESQDSFLTRSFHGIANEMKSHDARDGTLRGMRATAAAGFSNGGNIPLGYRSVDAVLIGNKMKKRLEIDPVEAETVRLAFKLAIEGDGGSGPLGVKKIAVELNRRGFRSRKGTLFGTGTVHTLLTQEAFAGSKPWNVRRKGGAFNPDDQLIHVAIPAIVDRETYDRVQELLQSREPTRRGPRLDSVPSLFGGIIRCGLCDGAMSPATGTSRRRTLYHYYKCLNATKKGKFVCEGITIPRPKAEALVTEALAERLLQPERVLSILEAIAARRQSRQASVNQRIADLQIEAAAAEKALQNFYKGIAAGNIDPTEPTLAEMLNGLKQKRDTANAARDRALATSSTPVTFDAAVVIEFTAELRKRITDGDTAARKLWITSIVDKIEVTREKIRVIGRNDNFERGLKNKTTNQPPVRSSVQEWCRKRESNPRPHHYE